MEILNDVEEKVHRMEIDLDDDERRLLSNYTIDNISEEDYEELLIEWAVISILKKAVESYEEDFGIT